MTNKQESKYSMKLAVRDFLNKNATITATLPGYGPLYALYLSNIAQIQVVREQQEIDKSGIKDNKDLLRNDLVAKAYDVGTKTEVYAKMTNNTVLAKEVHYSESDLSKAADSKLKDKALLIYDRATANLTALATYGINAATLTALKSAIDLFNAAIPTTRTGRTETKTATDQLADLFDSDDTILAKIDLLVEVVRLTQPIFYKAYQDNRKIVDTGTGSLALKIQAYDALSGDGLANVTLTLAPTNGLLKAASANGNGNIVKKTADGGGSHFKSLDDGTYTLTAEKPGFNKVVETVNVVNGEMTVLEIKLEKV